MLTFPTQAEQCLADFRSAKRTTSLVTLAQKMGADSDHIFGKVTYTFADDTSLVVTGRGKSHKVEIFLP